MSNEYVTESLKDAKDHLDSIMNPRADAAAELAIAERILRSCKSFLHGKNKEEWLKKWDKVEMEEKVERRKAEEEIRKEMKNEYLFHSAMANYELTTWIKKIEWLIGQLDMMNKTLTS